MTTSAKRALLWTPRVLCILFAGFISLFALDVFNEGLPFWKTIVALMIHLLPTFVIVGILVVAWRREWLGGVLFIALAAAYVVRNFPRMHWPSLLIIGGSSFVLGVMFLLGWCYREELHASN